MNRILDDRRERLLELCALRRVRRLEVFGSAATEEFDAERSDLDFLVEFETLTPAEHAECYFRLLADLESLFERSVDLVEVEPIRNPFFLEAIESTRVVLYPAA